ncbi:hypothetical protein IW261DRAFT_1420300 [Armillaria novae-zelandiae]|uniref:Uncharacterized protein n=1 Tax=Armillaria novae-zelandiae TaxID=153914 RepID=A0AA39P8B8_9AGAR|nr:hypothetical protein IW261DRAFT_1420300 [Armillaria novae-zelandiae]
MTNDELTVNDERLPECIIEAESEFTGRNFGVGINAAKIGIKKSGASLYTMETGWESLRVWTGSIDRRLLGVSRVIVSYGQMPPHCNAEDLALIILQDSSRKWTLRTVNKTFLVQCLQCDVFSPLEVECWDAEWRAQVIWLQIIAPRCEVIVEWTCQVGLPSRVLAMCVQTRVYMQPVRMREQGAGSRVGMSREWKAERLAWRDMLWLCRVQRTVVACGCTRGGEGGHWWLYTSSFSSGMSQQEVPPTGDPGSHLHPRPLA